MTFADRMAGSVRDQGSCLVVGLDPRPDKLPRALQGLPAPDAFEAFCAGIVRAVAPHAAAVKVQSACFEALGAPGWAAMERVVGSIRSMGTIPVILDAKRGDIGESSECYAEAFFGSAIGADALTVSPYMGRDSLEPFLRHARERGKGVFVLCRTSNPGAADFQERAAPEAPLYLAVARRIREWGEGARGSCGLSSVGAVVGATSPAAARRVREVLPDAWLLVPGVGAQGGKSEDLRPLRRPDGLGLLVNASRSVIYASGGDDWETAARAAAEELAAKLRF